MRQQVNVYDSDGELKTRGLLQLDAVRGLQLDDAGNLYVLHRPTERPWEFYLVISKFAPAGGAPLWSRRWDGYIGQAQVIFAPCHCITVRQHQTLDGKGYLYAPGQHSIQVIDCATGRLVGEFGSYGNADSLGRGSKSPHPGTPGGNHLGPIRLAGSVVLYRCPESPHWPVPHHLWRGCEYEVSDGILIAAWELSFLGLLTRASRMWTVY